GKAPDDFVFSRRDDIEVIVTMVPCDFKNPITAAANGFLTNDLTEKHPAGPTPDLLPGRCINYFEVIRLARPEIERQQFVRSIDDREDESRTAWNFRDLNIKRRIFFRHLRNIIRKRFTPLLGIACLPRVRERRRALCRGRRGMPPSVAGV